MLRTTAISLILLLSVGVMLPFTNSAHGVRQSAQVGQFSPHRYRSRAWWRRYRARLRKKRAAAELAHRQRLLSVANNISLAGLTVGTPLSVPESNGPEYSANTGLTSPGLGAPPELNRSAPKAENKATAKLPTVKLPGQMKLAVVALSRPNPAFLTSREESKMLAGTQMSDLRRIVIDKMLVAGGWVTNDFVQEIDGARVFVVTARTPKDVNSPEKAWTFYFTEADGRIYGLTTDAPIEFADRMSTEAERFIASLRARAQSK
ncbi:MAG TPA: hypothetical protein VFD63_07960 [Pyrinomonadaceae bacterium]|jgi:hypothetical protein|nr:hypothetical protein [Pyrinomonadaceae bacterium]